MPDKSKPAPDKPKADPPQASPVQPNAARPEVILPPQEEAEGSAIREPTKLIRIASMTRAMLDEVRQAPLDDAGRRRLLRVHSRSLDELRDVLSADLLDEFNQVFVPLDQANPSESELRVAQAQLIGWLEGLFHGIQASLFSQQVAAQAQLAEMQKRALGRGQEEQYPSGVYL